MEMCLEPTWNLVVHGILDYPHSLLNFYTSYSKRRQTSIFGNPILEFLFLIFATKYRLFFELKVMANLLYLCLDNIRNGYLLFHKQSPSKQVY